jgi:hypothetical protein
MPLTEAAFTTLVDAGCTQCGSKNVTIEALVSQKLPLYGGEVYGAPSWAYKGEELVAGTYRIACSKCSIELFSESACIRCAAAGGVARTLEAENAFPLLAACDICGSELLTAIAFVPAVAHYEGKRANKAKSQASPEEPGFHAVRVTCNRCPEVKTPPRSAGCALCGAKTNL